MCAETVLTSSPALPYKFQQPQAPQARSLDLFCNRRKRREFKMGKSQKSRRRRFKKNENENEILFAPQVTKRLGITSTTLGRWIAEARAGISTFILPFTEPGKQRKWLASSFDKWLLERQQATSQQSPVNPLKQHRRLEEQRARTQETLAKHYPHRKTKGGDDET